MTILVAEVAEVAEMSEKSEKSEMTGTDGGTTPETGGGERRGLGDALGRLAAQRKRLVVRRVVLPATAIAVRRIRRRNAARGEWETPPDTQPNGEGSKPAIVAVVVALVARRVVSSLASRR